MPTDFVPIGTYAGTMYRPAVLDRLWRTGDLDQALAALPAGIASPERYARDEQPPQIAFTSVQEGVRLPEPGMVWAVGVPKPRILLSVAMGGKSKVRDRQVVFDERLLPRPRIAEPVAEFQEDVQVELPPNRRVRLLVKASNVTGTTRSEYIDMVYTPPPPPEVTPPVAPEARPRLVLLSIGNEQSPNPKLLPPVRFADKDAQSLALFLPKHLLAATGDKPIQERPDNLVVLTGSLASASSIIRAFDRLREFLETKLLHQGDLVTIVLTSHVLKYDLTTLIATADTDGNRPPRTAISARKVSEQLGELTDYGCRVVLFLDGVHELPEGQYKSSIKPWVRDLWLNRRVTTFVASKEGASGVDVTAEHGLFALGLLRAFQANQNPHAAAYSLEQFKTAVVQEVLNLSSRQQEVGCYIPRAVSPRIRFATP